ARSSSSPPGSRSRGPARRSPARATTPRPRDASRCARPAYPTRTSGDRRPASCRPPRRPDPGERPASARPPGRRETPPARCRTRKGRTRKGRPEMPVWLELAIRVLAVVVAFLTRPLIVGQAEHKVMAHMQGRLGPMYAGAFHGWAQLIADGVKFAQKEDVTPRAADRPVFRFAPIVALIPYLLALLVIPLGPNDLVGQSLDVGLFAVLAVLGVR